MASTSFGIGLTRQPGILWAVSWEEPCILVRFTSAFEFHFLIMGFIERTYGHFRYHLQRPSCPEHTCQH